MGILKGGLAVFDIIKQARQLLLDAIKRVRSPIGGVEVCPVFFNVGKERLEAGSHIGAGPSIKTALFWHWLSSPSAQRSPLRGP